MPFCSAPIDDRVSRVAVPAKRKIDATDEGHGAVDHDDLFMMTPVHVRGEPRSVTKDEDASSLEDVVAVAPSVLSHRLLLNFQAEAQGVEASDVLAAIFEDRSPKELSR